MKFRSSKKHLERSILYSKYFTKRGSPTKSSKAIYPATQGR